MAETTLPHNPDWLVALDEQIQPNLKKLISLAPVSEASAERFSNGLLQAGVGIVEPFRHWLTNMKDRAEAGTPLHTFLAENEEEETRHWKWWLDMAEPYGLKSEDFASVTLAPKMRELTDYMDETSRTAPLPVAIAAVNYCIETGAAQATAAFTKGFTAKLGDKAGLWIEVHRKGDVEHSATARELLATLTDGDPPMQEQAADAARKAYRLFLAAMSEALSVPTGA